jgi:hypothetical protein
MNLQKNILIQNLKQSENDLKSAKEKSDKAYKSLESAEDFLAREVTKFADCKNCIQTITEEDDLVFVGHWYWKSSVYGLDQQRKCCKNFNYFADELPQVCQKCKSSWSYEYFIKCGKEYYKTREEIEICKVKYQNAKSELKEYRMKRWKDFFSFSWLFYKNADKTQPEFVEESRTIEPKNKILNVDKTQTIEPEIKKLNENNNQIMFIPKFDNQFLFMKQKQR